MGLFAALSEKTVRYRALVMVALICALVLLAYSVSMGPTRADAPAPSAAVTAPAPATTPATAEAKATFVGSDTCAGCHDDPPKALAAHTHGQMMSALEEKGKGYLCEGCHGPGSLHADNPSPETAAPLLESARSGAGCLTCHATKLSAMKWQASAHHREGVSCLQCHGTPAPPPATAKADGTAGASPTASPTPASTAPAPAAPPSTAPHGPDRVILPHAALTFAPSSESCLACHGEQRAEFAMPSHHPVMEGRVSCADCHDPHAPLDDSIKREVCQKCHAAQSGPHVFEHGAISGDLGDACLECHLPHGSPNTSLQKLTGRALCLQCHGDQATHFTGRQCLDCHSAVHGSNSSRSLLTE